MKKKKFCSIDWTYVKILIKYCCFFFKEEELSIVQEDVPRASNLLEPRQVNEPRKKRLRRDAETINAIEVSTMEMLKKVTDKITSSQAEDEFDTFGRHVTQLMRNANGHNREVGMKLVSKIMMEVRYGDLTDDVANEMINILEKKTNDE